MLGNLLFINRKSDPWQPTPNTSPGILSAPLEPIQDIIEDAEIIIDYGTHDFHCNTRN